MHSGAVQDRPGRSAKGRAVSTEPQDLNAWASAQAALLRAGDFAALDAARIADHIDAIAAELQRELARHASALCAHLLRSKYGAEGPHWDKTIAARREAVTALLAQSPSLLALVDEPSWQEAVWARALEQAAAATGHDSLPAQCPWDFHTEILGDRAID